MTRATLRIALALISAAAFTAGAEGLAIAGDPEAGDEAPAPGPASPFYAWDQALPTSADLDGLHVEIGDGILTFRADQEKTFDFEVRCDKVLNTSPMARVYVPPMEIARRRAHGHLAAGETMRVPLDLEQPPSETPNPILEAAGVVRVTIRRRGAANDDEPIAVLELRRVPPTAT